MMKSNFDVQLPCWIFETKLRGWYESEGSKAFSKAYNNLLNVSLKGAGHLPTPSHLFFLSHPLDCTLNLNYCNLFSFQ